MSEPSERSEREMSVLRLMYAVSLRLGEEMRRLSGDQLGHSEIMALSLIGRHKDLNQVQLAENLHRSAVYVSRLVDELVEAGLVERAPHKFDRRSKVLTLSVQGAVLFNDMQIRARDLAHQIFKETPDDRLAILHAQSHRISDRLHLATATDLAGLSDKA